MSTSAPEAPAAQVDVTVEQPAPPASDSTPDAPPVTPPADPPAPTDPPAEPQLETVADLGDGPDGDPVEGEDQLAKLKRIARRAERERREQTSTLTGERDQAITRAETAEAALTEAQAAAAELPDVKEKLANAELALLRYQVGSGKGLTMDQASRLKGSSQEEIEADLERFLAENAIPLPASRTEQREDRKAFVEKMNRNRF